LPTDVIWNNLVNASTGADLLQKTSGCDGCADAGAVSEQQITAGGGYLEFTVMGRSLVRYVGLNHSNSGTGSAEIPFALKLASGYVEVREYGQYLWDMAVNEGDVLRISVQNGTVQYSRNGTVFYTSRLQATYPLRADTALSSTGATVNNAVISNQ
jgi:hypothetical protein